MTYSYERDVFNPLLQKLCERINQRIPTIFYFVCLQLISKGIDWKSLLLEMSVCCNSSLAGTMFKMCGINSRFSFDPIKSFINCRTLKEKTPNLQGGSSAELSNVPFVKRRTNAVCAFESARVALTLHRAGKAALSARDATPSFTHKAKINQPR